jgi:hypothetical protein
VNALPTVRHSSGPTDPTDLAPDLVNASVADSRLILIPFVREIIQVGGDLTGPRHDPCREKCDMAEGVVEVMDVCTVP